MANDNLSQSQLIPDEARRDILRSAVFDIANASKALASSASLFPTPYLATDGQIDADIAIEAFTNMIEKRVNLMLSMIDNEDEQETPKKGGE